MSTPEDSSQQPPTDATPGNTGDVTPPAAPGQMPRYESVSPASPQDLQPRPTLVTAAFWLYIASAALSIISGIITIVSAPGQRQAIIDQLNKGNIDLHGQNVHTLADAAIAAAIGFSIVTMLFWVVTFVIFALYLRSGRNWARIILTILTALSIFNIFSIAGMLQFIASLVAVIFVWIPASNAWFKELKARRLPRV